MGFENPNLGKFSIMPNEKNTPGIEKKISNANEAIRKKAAEQARKSLENEFNKNSENDLEAIKAA